MVGRRVKQKVFKFQPFSRKQKQVLTWWTSKSAVKDMDGIIADGAIRSGKTISMSLSYVMWAMYVFDNQNFGMAGKTIGSFRRNVLFWLKLMLFSRGYKYRDHRADNLLEVSKNGVTNYFYIFGGKDERSQDLIQGITLAGMFFDEVALMPESFVNQATGRCSVDGSKYWFNCNPDGPYHWFKVNWIDKKKEKRLIYLHFTMDDNLSLSEEIKKRYRSMYSGVFFQRYILGMWTVAEGVIFDMFDRARHIYNKLVDTIASETYVSCDYGTQNATVFLLWQKGVDDVWYCIKEYYYSGRENKKQKTDGEFADELEKFIEGYKVKRIVIDPSAASFIAELKSRGLRIKKANNDVLDGIRYTGSMLNDDKIRFSPECKNTIQEFSAYIWDKKAADKGEDKPVKDHDHAMDAVRYFCYTITRKKGGISVWK
ncbi:PBSX family phage terminase large subunit [Jeotgalibaca porci]|uniref:PBSX family phage terminase large subunit n=2 Tax=Jeotgalibaca porci TaxID=1868793 RepID=UPI00359FB0C5